jgi:hypothetical protein
MMTDQQPMGGADPGQLAADLAAKQAAAPSGVTSVDPQVLIDAIEQLQARVQAMEAEKAAGSGRHPLLTTVEQLEAFVAHGHSDTAGHQLALDLVDAAGNAVDKGGNLTEVEKLSARLSKWLHRNAPQPGENYHYNNAVQIADFHLPDQIEGFVPPARPVTPLGGGRPVPVVQGSVTG